jgi:hypothetical protein
MGLQSSPYQAVQAMGVAEEVVCGVRKVPTNVYPWDTVRMNLQGTSDYRPNIPWVSKYRLSDEKIAADLFIFVETCILRVLVARKRGQQLEERPAL